MSRVAIVAALKREVFPLVKAWRVSEKVHGDRRFRFYEHDDDIVLVCGGIGTQAARRAAEAVIALYSPLIVYSVGFAGALDPTLKVADVIQPKRVVNASDGSSVNLDHGEGVLLSFGSVVNPEQKAKLRDSFGAQLVDMEAAAVARAAEARGIGFAAMKTISDEMDFVFPSMERFVDGQGQFLEMRFAAFAAFRPWLWLQVYRLARNSNRASRALCDALRKLTASQASPAAHALEAVNRP